MINSRVHPILETDPKIKNLKDFKKDLIEKMSNDLNNYEAFKMKNKDKFEFILLKKGSIQYNILTNLLKVNKPIYVDEIE